MSNFLDNLADRCIDPGPVALPLQLSRFEPVPGNGIEQDDVGAGESADELLHSPESPGGIVRQTSPAPLAPPAFETQAAWDQQTSSAPPAFNPNSDRQAVPAGHAVQTDNASSPMGHQPPRQDDLSSLYDRFDQLALHLQSLRGQASPGALEPAAPPQFQGAGHRTEEQWQDNEPAGTLPDSGSLVPMPFGRPVEIESKHPLDSPLSQTTDRDKAVDDDNSRDAAGANQTVMPRDQAFRPERDTRIDSLEEIDTGASVRRFQTDDETSSSRKDAVDATPAVPPRERQMRPERSTRAAGVDDVDSLVEARRLPADKDWYPPPRLVAESPRTAAAPTINVTIGRIEVKAVREPAPATQPRASAVSPVMGLAEYLERRAAGRRP